MGFWSNLINSTTSGSVQRSLSKVAKCAKDLYTKYEAKAEANLLILGWQASGKSLFLHIGGGIKKRPCAETQSHELQDGICFIKDSGFFTSKGFRATCKYDIGGEYFLQRNALKYDTLKDIDVVLYFFNAKQLSDKEDMLDFAPADYTLGAIRQFILHFTKEFPAIDSNADKDKQKEQKERQRHKILKKIIFVGTHTDQLADDGSRNESTLKTLLGFNQLKKELQLKLPGIGVYFVCGSQCDDNNPTRLKKEVWEKVIACIEEE